jgi:hypothetical protein
LQNTIIIKPTEIPIEPLIDTFIAPVNVVPIISAIEPHIELHIEPTNIDTTIEPSIDLHNKNPIEAIVAVINEFDNHV